MSDLAVTARAPALPQISLYAERRWPRRSALDKIMGSVAATLRAGGIDGRGRRLRNIVGRVQTEGERLRDLSDEELRQCVPDLTHHLRTSRRPSFAAVARGFALVREAADRILGIRHFDVQIQGGYGLWKGMVIEMDTGEGKTLTATLPAIIAALAGDPVHVVTVNDYLAQRDAETLRPLYGFFGLSVGLVVQGQGQQERQAAYACDVTYCTNKELAFDYLRDRMALGRRSGSLRLRLEALFGAAGAVLQLRLRGLAFAIVDEADSVLIDEARTPLIISGQDQDNSDIEMAQEALSIATALVEGKDYRVYHDERRVELLPDGRDRLDILTEPLSRRWRATLLREERIRQALTALHLFRRDEHYVVQDGKVVIVDEYSGRLMSDRFWSEGLHEIVELKENCEPSPRRTTLARMTYQRFFRRYRKLAGMSGTVREVAHELGSVYGLTVAKIPTNRPSRRHRLPDRIFPTRDAKWRAIVERVAIQHASGCPVLLGTRSVAASQEASEYLTRAGLPHVVLNATQDANEAEIITEAGNSGSITVATNMAGRGTDIVLGNLVAGFGGLQVIMSERHDARRIDRQLEGRCARQGDPGTTGAILSLEDPLLDMAAIPAISWLARRLGGRLGQWPGKLAIRHAQKSAERLHSRMRRDLLNMDERLGDVLAFSGQGE